MADKGKWPKAIFFDSKNTLWDWGLHIWTEVAAEILNKYGVKNVDPQKFANKWHTIHLGYQHRVAFADYREFKDCHKDALMDACKIFGVPGVPSDVEFMDSRLGTIQPYPDTIEALKNLQKMTRVLVFSNVETAHLAAMVDRLPDFKPDFVGDMQQAGMAKPNPRAYYWVLDKNGLGVEDVIYCCGPMWDVQGALAVGMKAAWLNRGKDQLDGNVDGGIKPTWEISNLHELVKIVESFIKGG